MRMLLAALLLIEKDKKQHTHFSLENKLKDDHRKKNTVSSSQKPMLILTQMWGDLQGRIESLKAVAECSIQSDIM